MRFVSFLFQGVQSYGLADEDFTEIVDLQKAYYALKNHSSLPKTLQSGIEAGEAFIDMVTEVTLWLENDRNKDFIYKVEDERVKLLSPIIRPKKNIFCIGKNYRDHALELGGENEIPSSLMVFSKATTAVIGHRQSILRHSDVTECLDYEGELAVVIGKKGKAIKEVDAADYIFGYTILNDITARDLQKEHKQFLLGKSLDTSCPIGPVIVSKDEIKNPHNLSIETKVNGELRQKSHTSKMMFDIPKIIATISRGITLEPGDIIATGTPAGVGKGFNPPKYLQTGDQIEITVEGIGTLVNGVSDN